MVEENKPRMYRCSRCGHEKEIKTNHRGPCWSAGHFNVCPKCPPWAKYPEFGGMTTWEYVKEDDMEEVKALNFTKGQEVYQAVVMSGGPRAGCVRVLAGKVVQAGVSRIRVVCEDCGVHSGDQAQGLPRDAGRAHWQEKPEDAVAHLLASTVRRVKSLQDAMRKAQAELLAVEQYTGVSVQV